MRNGDGLSLQALQEKLSQIKQWQKDSRFVTVFACVCSFIIGALLVLCLVQLIKGKYPGCCCGECDDDDEYEDYDEDDIEEPALD